MRIPLYSTLESRDGTLAADANLKNALVEVGEGDGTILVVKRPGIALTNEIITGGLAQGIADLNGLVYSVFDDTLLAFNPTAPETITGGWNLGSASPILGGLLDYDNGETYDPGDFVLYPDEDGDDGVWFTVATVSGIPPGHTPAAYPYWSRYRNLPVGTHPSVSYSIIQGPLEQEGTLPGPSTSSSSSSLTVKVGSQTFGVLPGTLEGTVTASPYFSTSTYSNYAILVAGGVTSGVISGPYPGGPFVDTTVFTPATSTSLYIAAQDYARSILA